MRMKKYILTALMLLLVLPGFSQRSKVTVYSSNDDSTPCEAFLSTYRDFFSLELYEDAYQTWVKVFYDCPASSEKMYVDGVTMYRSFIEEASNEQVREALIDTLLLIYDRRMEYFGGEGNVLGRKGRDLLTYRSADIGQVQKAYEMLEKSIELQGDKSQESVMLLFISAGIMLNNNQLIDDYEVLDDYLLVIGIIEPLEKRSSRWKKTRKTIDEIVLKEDILNCETLDRYYEPQFEQNRNNKAYLETVIKLYGFSACKRSDIYLEASENLYEIEPGPESAHNLGILFITRNDNEKAASYLKEAVKGENIDAETRAQWYYELALVSLANKDYCESIEHAREAISLKSDFGAVYILLGDAFIESRNKLGDDFQQRTAYWAAADMYSKAASLDPSVAEEARQRLTDNAGQYPSSEDIFFRDIKVGDPFRVGGCINEDTSVRSRD
ncbi:MAG: hypothetical protein QNK35_17090 [Bacteroides sp.]|nr:hypothetical protein [Bacteroides sp.]